MIIHIRLHKSREQPKQTSNQKSKTLIFKQHLTPSLEIPQKPASNDRMSTLRQLSKNQSEHNSSNRAQATATNS
jgi:hypothetical protein